MFEPFITEQFNIKLKVMNRLKKINHLGQSIWLDFFDRHLMDSGKLQNLIDEDGISGITSNPSIFEKAVDSSNDYDEDIQKLSAQGKSTDDIFFGFALKDIQRAADILKPVYTQSNGTDGFVSMEVLPGLARNTEGTIAQARQLWKTINRENVMIKIPGTAEGLPAIRQCICEGININVTLLFGLDRYEEVTQAYLSGLEDRVKNELPIDHIASVASFFLSRIDVMINPILEERSILDLKGKIAIDMARVAYRIYTEVFNSERFLKLKKNGAKPQKVLWASTSTKDPEYPDVMYVEALIGPDTINTLPMETIEAFRDHGHAHRTVDHDLVGAVDQLEFLKTHGVNIDFVTSKLEEEGIQKFNDAYHKLSAAINKKKEIHI